MLPAIFVGITFISFILFYLGTGKNRSVLLFLPLWAAFTVGLAYSGFFLSTDTFPPRVLLIILPAIVYVIWFYRKLDVARLKPGWLLAVHIVRLPVELTLYQLYLSAKVPVIMTFEGWNFDILSGITAAILLLYRLAANKEINRKFLISWNIAGLVLLGIIVVTAILSAPLPIQQFAFDQPNVAVLEFPYAWLPAIVVPVVLLSHLLCLKMLTRGKHK